MTVTAGARLEHRIGADGLLVLRLRSGNVALRGVDGETARLHDRNGHDLADMFTIEAADGSLSLVAGRGLEIVVGSRSFRRGAGGGHAPDLEVEVPRRASLVLQTASGEVRADGLAGDQRYQTASGDLDLRDVSGRISVDAASSDTVIHSIGDAEVRLRTMSGDIEIHADTLSALEVATTSGDIRVAGRLRGPGPFSVETVSGDAIVEPSGAVRVEMTSLTGDLTADAGEARMSERGTHTVTIGRDGPTLRLRSTSGDLHVGRSASREEPASAPEPTSNGAIAAAYDDARLRILRSLERGEIDVAEAGRRLETLDADDPDQPHG